MLSSGFSFASGKLSGAPASVNAGFYLASGKLSGDPASVNASRREALRPPPCTPQGSFPVTLRGGRRCALPPAPPTRFFRLAPVRLWTCYLAGFLWRL